MLPQCQIPTCRREILQKLVRHYHPLVVSVQSSHTVHGFETQVILRSCLGQAFREPDIVR